MQSADEDFATTLKELDEYVKITLEAKIDVNADDIKAAQDDIKAAQEDLDALWKKISGGEGSLEDLISKNATAISDLKDAIEDELDVIKGDIKDIQADIKKINGQITAINQNLAGLHTLVVSRLTSISLAPDLFVDGIEAVRFTSLQYSPMGESENASIPATSYKFSTAALATASYHFNPASFKLANADYGYIDRTAEVVETTRAIAASKLVEIVGEPEANPVTGTVDFKLLRLNSHTTQPGLDRTNMIALQATLKGDAVDEGEKNAVITAPYVAVYDAILSYEDVRIADKETLTTGADEAHYATTFDACTKEDPRYKIPYDKEFNLKDLVATCFGNNGHDEFPIADYKLSYRFAVASTAYNIEEGNTETNQQKWIKCNDAIEGKYQAEGFNPEAFGRTPILKVELVDEAGNVVRRGFVKIEFGVTKQDDLVVGDKAYDLVAKCTETAAEYTITEQFIRENVYRVITNGKETSMSHEEFWNIYTTSTAEVKKNNQVFSMSVPKIVDGTTEVGTATKKIVWEFTHGELKAIGAGGSQFVATVTVKNKLTSSEYPASITFKFTVNVKLPELTLDATENDIYWTKDGDEYKYFNVNVSVPNSVASPASDCQFRRALTEAYSAYTVKGLPGCESARYKVIKTYSNGNLTSPVMSGVQIDGNYITLDKSNAAVKAALNSANGLQAVVAHIYTMSNGDEVTVNEFMVDFIRPVNLNMPSGIAVIDAKTGGDVADFQWNGLLTDWRNEAIVKDSWSWVENVHSYWKRVCTPEFEYVQGHEEMVTPAQLDVEYGTIKFTTTTVTTMYTGKATYRYYNRLGGSTKKTYTTEEFLTQAEVDASLEAQKLAGWPLIYPHVELDGDIIYTEVSKPASTTIEYDYVKSINYVPATYKWVEGNWTMVPHRHTEKPAFEGTSYGQISGCWEWTKKEWGRPDWNPGQYWFFYGPFGDVTLDLNKVTTSLEYNGNKLPDGATLVQTGNTVKYVNVSSPVGYTYQIFIPATVNYGWGTTSTLTITVNPNN